MSEGHLESVLNVIKMHRTPDSARRHLALQAEPGKGLLNGGELAAPLPTSYTPAAVASASALLERVYKPGFLYHKAGVFLTDIVADNERQQRLMRKMDGERHPRLMEGGDHIDRKHDRRTVHPLAIGHDRAWEMRRTRLSERYTTRLDEVLRVKAS